MIPIGRPRFRNSVWKASRAESYDVYRRPVDLSEPERLLYDEANNLRTMDWTAQNLLVIRKLVEHTVASSDIASKETFYVASLSARTICFKGLMLCHKKSTIAVMMRMKMKRCSRFLRIYETTF